MGLTCSASKLVPPLFFSSIATMKVLAVETATSWQSVAILDESRVLARHRRRRIACQAVAADDRSIVS